MGSMLQQRRSASARDGDLSAKQTYAPRRAAGPGVAQHSLRSHDSLAPVPPTKPSFLGLSNELTVPQQAPLVVQPKLMIGAPGDRYEQEADRVANQVVQHMHSPTSNTTDTFSETPVVQRKLSTPLIGAAAGSIEAPSEVAAGITAAGGRGHPLDEHVRQPIEQALGLDFSRVRVHTDEQADKLNQSVGARAFTAGQELFFKRGEYQPRSKSGQELIAHELMHVAQQHQESNSDKEINAQPRIKSNVVQCKVNTEKIGEIKKALKIPEDEKLATYEISRSPSIEVTKKFSEYPDDLKDNHRDDLKDESICTVYPDATGDAYSFIQERVGGGVYNSDKKMILYNEGFLDSLLIHEFGHAAQHLRKEWGYTEKTVNYILLEFHNIIMHENPAHKDSQEKLRVGYYNYEFGGGAGKQEAPSGVSSWSSRELASWSKEIEEFERDKYQLFAVDKEKNIKIWNEIKTNLSPGESCQYSGNVAIKILKQLRTDLKSLLTRLEVLT